MEVKRALWNIREASEYVGVHKITVYRLLKKGQFPGKKVGGQWRFSQKELDKHFSTME